MKKSQIKHLLTLLAVGLFLAFPVSVSAAEKEESQAVEIHTYTPSSGISTYSIDTYDYQYGYWRQSGSKWWFQYTDGSYAANDVYIIDGTVYGFDVSGWMVTGWHYYSQYEHWFYFTSGGPAYDGWLKQSGSWYYLDNGLMLADGVYEIDYIQYGFDTAGQMVTGWQYFDGYGWYYFAAGGPAYDGWLYDCGNWYYLNEGQMLTGFYDIDGVSYCFTPSGAMVTGWYYDSAYGWHYFESSGAAHNGWLYDSGNWYYAKPDGQIYCDGVYEIEGNLSVFAENGVWLGYYY